MGKGILMWMLGVPASVVVILKYPSDDLFKSEQL
jgi:hypothetical protein